MKKSLWFLLLFITCVFVLSGAGCAESERGTENGLPRQEYLLKAAELPPIPPCPDMSDPAESDNEGPAQYAAWRQAKAEHRETVVPGMEQIQAFARESAREFAADDGKRNFLYSPLSLWLCLHTLSDLTEGGSRAQIERLIGRQPEEDRDAQVDAVFRALYREDDDAVCIPASSVWLDDAVSLSDTLLEQLSKAAHSSVFQGPIGEEAYDTALRLWLNEQTRGLLEASVSGLRFSPDAGLTVCSSLYMKNGWCIPFVKDETAPDVFYTDTGEVTADFMHSSGAGVIYSGEGFTAAVLDFSAGGGVAFLLPDAGLSPEELLKSDEVFRFLFSGRDWDEAFYGKVNLSVPKMDCLSEMSLRSALENMGITDIFDAQKARFSAELSSASALWVSDLQQYVRLIMDEDGVEAAAITLTLLGSAPARPEEEIDFTLNRPFIFAVMSEKNIPLFIGTYRAPA